MNLKVPDHILSIPAYVPGKPVEEVERERGIRNSIKLASNENPLGPSPKALEAVRGILAMVHRYPESGGYELTRRLAARLNLTPEHIVLGNGSDDIIVMLATAFLQPGDEVVMARPSFQMYEIVTRAAGAVPVEVPLSGVSERSCGHGREGDRPDPHDFRELAPQPHRLHRDAPELRGLPGGPSAGGHRWCWMRPISSSCGRRAAPTVATTRPATGRWWV